MISTEQRDCVDTAWSGIDLMYCDPPFGIGKTFANDHLYLHHYPLMEFRDRDYPLEAEWVGRQNVPVKLFLRSLGADRRQYLSWLGRRVDHLVRAMSQDSVLVLHLDWRQSSYARCLLDQLLAPFGFTLVNEIVWHYRLGAANSKRFLPRKHDNLLVYGRGDYPFTRVQEVSAWQGGLTNLTDVWHITMNNTAAERTGYPTQKPLRLMDQIIRVYSEPGNVVGDPFMGSGTTLVAAQKLGRKALGCDISPEAVRVTESRLCAG